MPDKTNNQHAATLAAQALGWVDETTRSVTPPLYPSTTYERNTDLSYHDGRCYTRADNPTYDQACAVLNALEGGADTRLFASGMAAAVCVLQALQPGDHVVAPKVMYWALRGYMQDVGVRAGLTFDFVDNGDSDAWRSHMKPGKTRLVWLETPANPDWQVTDIAAVAKAAHEIGAVVAVDNTVATPLLTRPIEFGADIVMHSATKYLNGHSDVLAGTLTCAKKDAFWEQVCKQHKGGGAVLGVFETWLLLRGMRTVAIRVERASENAMAIARHFENHPEIEQVQYPGLESHIGHDIAKKQMQGGFGGMLSLRVKGGTERAIAFHNACKLFKRATSLGGVESLIEHRASVEGPTSPVPGDLLRVSVGIENIDDLIADIETALGHTK
ncbi:trans-sulfuration enzyme family protein [Thalassospira marina]|uniref:Cystathionine gamma-synthase n=1 Tax=Thalassospira marina TaxID=2048283 RepID=A0ABM6Q8Y7_9PROT|nr:PLP-dependent aspartate aminotransferase family protein [Thalassospira marina]AUG52633.1 cystathionine gamma-synthase [Thalassospira marina]